MKKGLDERDMSGMTLRFSGWGDADVIHCDREQEDDGCEGKITILRLIGDVQGALGNTVISCNREKSGKEMQSRVKDRVKVRVNGPP